MATREVPGASPESNQPPESVSLLPSATGEIFFITEASNPNLALMISPKATALIRLVNLDFGHTRLSDLASKFNFGPVMDWLQQPGKQSEIIRINGYGGQLIEPVEVTRLVLPPGGENLRALLQAAKVEQV